MMETTVLTIDSKDGKSTYYFDFNTLSGNIKVFWHEKFIKSFDSLESALIWFVARDKNYIVQDHTDQKDYKDNSINQ